MIVPLALWWGTARSRAATLIVGGVCAVSVLVQLPPVLVEISHSRIASGKPARPERLLDWDSSPLVVTSRSAIAAVPANVAYLSGAASPPTTRASNAPLSERVGFSLDFWWLYVVYLGAVPLRVALLTVTVMVASAAWLSRRLWSLYLAESKSVGRAEIATRRTRLVPEILQDASATTSRFGLLTRHICRHVL